MHRRGVGVRVRVFNLILTGGQVAGALSAFAVFCFGVWKYAVVPAQQIAKVYKSIGKNGEKTMFENLHDIKRELAELKAWRADVDQVQGEHELILRKWLRDSLGGASPRRD